MAKAVVGMTISLDGFVNDRRGSVEKLYPDFEELRNGEVLQQAMKETGAVIMGRRAYDMGEGDFTGYEFQTPIFVLTHNPPKKSAKGENDKLRFFFVSDGVDSAIKQAKAAAGDMDVQIIGGASTIQQCLKAGLVDEIQIDIMPLLLGQGLRLFDSLESEIQLEKISVIESPTRTHLSFRVLR